MATGVIAVDDLNIKNQRQDYLVSTSSKKSTLFFNCAIIIILII